MKMMMMIAAPWLAWEARALPGEWLRPASRAWAALGCSFAIMHNNNNNNNNNDNNKRKKKSENMMVNDKKRRRKQTRKKYKKSWSVGEGHEA